MLRIAKLNCTSFHQKTKSIFSTNEY